jgi:hypothetical protein
MNFCWQFEISTNEINNKRNYKRRYYRAILKTQVSGVHLLTHEINAHADDNIHKFGTIKGRMRARSGKKKFDYSRSHTEYTSMWSNNDVPELILSRKYVTGHKPTVTGFCYFTLWTPRFKERNIYLSRSIRYGPPRCPPPPPLLKIWRSVWCSGTQLEKRANFKICLWELHSPSHACLLMV